MFDFVKLLIEAGMPYMQRFFLFFILILSSLSISGCSQKFQDVNDTLNLALFGNEDTVLSQSEINALPYASMYAQIEGGPQAFLVLGLVEPINQFKTHPSTRNQFHSTESQTSSLTTEKQQLKWLSSDKGMLVTQSGRLVKTLNLPHGNLSYISNLDHDPVAIGLHQSNAPQEWTRFIDWQPGYHFGYTLSSRFAPGEKQTIRVNEQLIDVLYIIEHVIVRELDLEFENEFWIDSNTGQVIKSRQKIAPGLPYISTTILKPFA